MNITPSASFAFLVVKVRRKNYQRIVNPLRIRMQFKKKLFLKNISQFYVEAITQKNMFPCKRI